MTRTLYLGSGGFGLPILERLAQLRPGQVAVGTVPDARRGRRSTLQPTVVKEKALELSLPCFEVATLKGDEGSRLLQESAADLVIVCDFRLFLTSKFLAAVAKSSYNFHPSLLPRYRGAAPVAHALLDQQRTHGVTLYQMIRAMDAGPIVAQEQHEISELLPRPLLEQQLSARCADMLESWLPQLEAGDVSLSPQDDSAATFAHALTRQDGELDWSCSAAALHAQVLALQPWPGSFTHWVSARGGDPVRVAVHEALVGDPEQEGAPAGSVRSCSPEGLAIACGAGGTETLLLTELQRSGKKRMAAADFLRGNQVSVGDRMIVQGRPGAEA